MSSKCRICREVDTNDCVEASLEMLRRHFAASVQAQAEHKQQLTKLINRNREVENSISMLRQELALANIRTNDKHPLDRSSSDGEMDLNNAAVNCDTFGLSGSEESVIEETEALPYLREFNARDTTTKKKTKGCRTNSEHPFDHMAKIQSSLSLTKRDCGKRQTKQPSEVSARANRTENRQPLKRSQSALSWIVHRPSSTMTQVHADENETMMQTSLLPQESIIYVPPPVPAVVAVDETNYTPSTPPILKRIKMEVASPMSSHNKNDFEYEEPDACVTTEESEETIPMPMPVVVKQEPVTPEKINHLKQFQMECPDCEKVLQRHGGHLSVDEIRACVDTCRSRQHKLITPVTPPGFWDPRIPIFSDNDPRNEVLIDKRFTDKKGTQR